MEWDFDRDPKAEITQLMTKLNLLSQNYIFSMKKLALFSNFFQMLGRGLKELLLLFSCIR